MNPGHRRTPCVLTPPSTPINSDLSTMNANNGLPAHLYSAGSYRATANDYTNEKVSPMHYPSNAYTGHQTTAVDLYTDLYNSGYSTCSSQNTEFTSELPAMDMTNVYNVNSYGYESHKFNGEHSTYFDTEKKFDVGASVDASRNICVQNGYMHYNNC